VPQCSSLSATGGMSLRAPGPQQRPCARAFLSAGYLSNCILFGTAGQPWSEEEHRLFLLGLQQLGKVGSHYEQFCGIRLQCSGERLADKLSKTLTRAYYMAR